MKILVIVESPAKCGKIQSYLGNEYIVKASFGHIRNLDKKKGIKAIDVDNNFNPSFILINEKKKYIKDLQDCAKKASEVIIASDLDREGEAIGYHLVIVLKLDINKTKRIIFNEITKKAIEEAIKNPRKLDMNLIYAAQARQILDYIIGFDISPILWKYVKNNLSVGRCQSPGLKMIYEKEEEINNFISNNYFNLLGRFKNQLNIIFECNSKTEFKNKDEVITNLNLFKEKDTLFKIFSITNKESISKPSAPYITSTIQQDASTKLGINPKQTMQYLQKLYEAGKITYMRTDSKILSEQCTNFIKHFILNRYGNEYHHMRKFKDNSKNAQEAHECIRPVDINTENIKNLNFSTQEEKLYELIWKRTIASQMADMITDVYKVKIENNKNKIIFESAYDKTKFLGYGKVYNLEIINEIDNIIDKMQENELVTYDNIIASEKLTNPPCRYTEASIIKEFEKKGIGRPSTFSSIIDTLFKREYIIKESRKGIDKELLNISILKNNDDILEELKTVKTNAENNKIYITELGNTVLKFMIDYFNNILETNFTSEMEDNLDEIAKVNYNWIELVDKVYKSFHPKVLELMSQTSTKRSDWEKKNLKPILGVNPKTLKNIYCYKGKYGPVIQEGEIEARYLSIPKNYDYKSITLEQILDLLDYPKNIGTIEDKDILICIGSNGFYAKYNDNNYTINNQNITIDDFSEIINKKKNTIIKEFTDKKISIRTGQYGPYILKIAKKNIIVKVPNKFIDNPSKMTINDCYEQLQNKNYSKK